MRHACGQPLRAIAENFFEQIPTGADAYFMQHIIHDWDDESALSILGNVRQALAAHSHGRLIFVDIVLPEDSRPHPGKLLDLLMDVLRGTRTDPGRMAFALGKGTLLYDKFNSVYRGYFGKQYPARAFVGSGPLLRGGHFEMLGIAVKAHRRAAPENQPPFPPR